MPAPRPATTSSSLTGVRRSCGCVIPEAISDAVVDRNPRVHDDDCPVREEIEFGRAIGRPS